MQRWILLPGAPRGLPEDFSSAWEELRGETVDQNRFRHVERVEAAGRTLFVKFFHKASWKDRLRNLLTPPRTFSQAAREVKVAALLEEAGIGTVPMAAFGEERFGPFEKRSILVTVGIPGPTLGEALRRDPGKAPGLAGVLEEILGRLLARRIYLPDLSLEHILLPREAPPLLLDLHNGAGPIRWNSRRIARMLGRLWAGARGTVPPFLALRSARKVLERAGTSLPAGEILEEAARRGERWETRERRKRRREVEP